jgi:hypothetical protein
MALVNTIDEWRELRGAMTKKESAQSVNDLFVADTKRKNKGKKKKTSSFREWAIANIGEGYGVAESHNRLLNFGTWVDPLWVEVEQGLPVSRAVLLGREAVSRARTSRITEAEALLEVLKEFKDPATRRVSKTSKGGVTYKSREIKKPTKPRKKAEDVDLSGVYVGKYDATNGRELWSAICSMAAAFVKIRAVNVDASIKKRLTKDFAFGLRVVYEDFQRDLEKHNKRARLEAENLEYISRDALRLACRVLQISTPKVGDPVDMKAARSRYKTLAGRFHPDRNNGDEKFVKQYHAVNEAWKAIKLYMESYDAKKTSH